MAGARADGAARAPAVSSSQPRLRGLDVPGPVVRCKCTATPWVSFVPLLQKIQLRLMIKLSKVIPFSKRLNLNTERWALLTPESMLTTPAPPPYTRAGVVRASIPGKVNKRNIWTTRSENYLWDVEAPPRF